MNLFPMVAEFDYIPFFQRADTGGSPGEYDVAFPQFPVTGNIEQQVGDRRDHFCRFPVLPEGSANGSREFERIQFVGCGIETVKDGTRGGAVECFGNFPRGAHGTDSALGFAQSQIKSDPDSCDIGNGILCIGGNAVFADRAEMDSEDRLVVSACLSELSDEERQAVVLHAVAGLKHREIAKLMNVPLSTELSKYNRALEKLKKTLSKE